MEISLTPLLIEGDLIIDVDPHLETDLGPHGLHQFSGLMHIGRRREGLQGDFCAHRLGLPEQESGFVRVVGWPRFHPWGIPGARWGVKPAGDFTTAVEHDLLSAGSLEADIEAELQSARPATTAAPVSSTPAAARTRLPPPVGSPPPPPQKKVTH